MNATSAAERNGSDHANDALQLPSRVDAESLSHPLSAAKPLHETQLLNTLNIELLHVGSAGGEGLIPVERNDRGVWNLSSEFKCSGR